MFPSSEIAAAVVDHFLANPMELDGRHLIVRHYTEPPNHVPKGESVTDSVCVWICIHREAEKKDQFSFVCTFFNT